MAKIPRKTALQFAANYLAAASGQIAQFGSVKTGTPVYSGDPAVLQALTAWLQGWSGAVVANSGGNNQPTLEEMNAVLVVLSYLLMYIQQEGVEEWDADTTYYQGSWAKATDGSGLAYVSLVNNNTNQALTDATKWTSLASLINVSNPVAPKAFIVFSDNGSGPVILQQSASVTGIAKNSTGNYTVSFLAGTFTNPNVAVLGTCQGLIRVFPYAAPDITVDHVRFDTAVISGGTFVPSNLPYVSLSFAGN